MNGSTGQWAQRAVRLRAYVAAQLCAVPAGSGERAAAELIAAGMEPPLMRIEAEGGQDAVYALVAAFEHAPHATAFLQARPDVDPGMVLHKFEDWPHELEPSMARRVCALDGSVLVLFPSPLTTEALTALYA